MVENHVATLNHRGLKQVFKGVTIKFTHAEALCGSELDTVLSRQLRGVFKSIFASDEIEDLPVEMPSAYVFNTEPRGCPGAHWVTVYITESGFTTYFDPN